MLNTVKEFSYIRIYYYIPTGIHVVKTSLKCRKCIFAFNKPKAIFMKCRKKVSFNFHSDTMLYHLIHQGTYCNFSFILFTGFLSKIQFKHLRCICPAPYTAQYILSVCHPILFKLICSNAVQSRTWFLKLHYL